MLPQFQPHLRTQSLWRKPQENGIGIKNLLVIFRVSFTNFSIHLLEFLNILHWFFLLLQVKSKDLKEIELQYFVEIYQKKKHITLIATNFDIEVPSLMRSIETIVSIT